ncbi:hypothetical protein CLF_108818 [Clonorchis sinensis]|uniref:Uncharacterized protein n=1 Tax=Clonorchis sinensis TaxID=79923 RepID=G7YIL0_CLOSI|nr:hypothetical protein CLF_108818 [Clonorchis sinensis]
MRRKLEGLQNPYGENLADLEKADEIVLVFEEEQKVQVFLEQLTKFIPSFGMHAAPTKCKAIFGDMQSLNTPIAIQGEALEVVEVVLVLIVETDEVNAESARLGEAPMLDADLMLSMIVDMQSLNTPIAIQGEALEVVEVVLVLIVETDELEALRRYDVNGFRHTFRGLAIELLMAPAYNAFSRISAFLVTAKRLFKTTPDTATQRNSNGLTLIDEAFTTELPGSVNELSVICGAYSTNIPLRKVFQSLQTLYDQSMKNSSPPPNPPDACGHVKAVTNRMTIIAERRFAYLNNPPGCTGATSTESVLPDWSVDRGQTSCLPAVQIGWRGKRDNTIQATGFPYANPRTCNELQAAFSDEIDRNFDKYNYT